MDKIMRIVKVKFQPTGRVYHYRCNYKINKDYPLYVDSPFTGKTRVIITGFKLVIADPDDYKKVLKPKGVNKYSQQELDNMFMSQQPTAEVEFPIFTLLRKIFA